MKEGEREKGRKVEEEEETVSTDQDFSRHSFPTTQYASVTFSHMIHESRIEGGYVRGTEQKNKGGLFKGNRILCRWDRSGYVREI